jgi:hypothetical protein
MPSTEAAAKEAGSIGSKSGQRVAESLDLGVVTGLRGLASASTSRTDTARPEVGLDSLRQARIIAKNNRIIYGMLISMT